MSGNKKYLEMIHHRFNFRRGLAPLELVAATPLLMFLMALMVTFAVAAVWKIRVAVNARHVVWRDLDIRNSHGEANITPPRWPSNGVMSSIDANPEPFDNDPFADHPVVRGPTVSDNSGHSLDVKLNTLDMTEGMNQGFARLQRKYALMEKMGSGQFDFSRHHQIYSDTRWNIFDMGIDNSYRRILLTYDFDLFSYDQSALSTYNNAKSQLESIYNDPGIYVLDRDPELGVTQYRQFVTRDFYPHPNMSMCTSDLNTFITVIGPDFAERIKGSNRYQSVGRTMTETFINLYENQLAGLPQNDPARAPLEALLQKLYHDRTVFSP